MKKISNDNFWQKIHSLAREKSFPLRVMFELTYDCNFRCRHCYVPQDYRVKYKRKQLSTKQVFSFLDKLRDSGCFYLGFTGGEPFIRPDMMQILRYAKKQGFQLIIYTNGSLLNDRIIGSLAELNLNKVDITLPGISKAVFESVTGKAGSYDAVFKAINLLHKHKINLGVKTCLLKENSSEIKQINKFAKSLNAHYRLDTLLCARLDGSKQPYQYRGELAPVKRISRGNKLSEQEDCESGQFQNSYVFECGAGKSQAAITPVGELKLCLMIDYPKYDLLELPFSRAWKKLVNCSRAIKPDKSYQCPSCDLRPYCKWCPARSWMHDRTFFSCDPQIRAWAQRIKEEHGS